MRIATLEVANSPDIVCLRGRQQRNMPTGMAKHHLTHVTTSPSSYATVTSRVCSLHARTTPVYHACTHRTRRDKQVYTVLPPAVHDQRGAVQRARARTTTRTYLVYIPVTSDPSADILLHADLWDWPKSGRCLVCGFARRRLSTAAAGHSASNGISTACQSRTTRLLPHCVADAASATRSSLRQHLLRFWLPLSPRNVVTHALLLWFGLPDDFTLALTTETGSIILKCRFRVRRLGTRCSAGLFFLCLTSILLLRSFVRRHMARMTPMLTIASGAGDTGCWDGPREPSACACGSKIIDVFAQEWAVHVG